MGLGLHGVIRQADQRTHGSLEEKFLWSGIALFLQTAVGTLIGLAYYAMKPQPHVTWTFKIFWSMACGPYFMLCFFGIGGILELIFFLLGKFGLDLRRR